MNGEMFNDGLINAWAYVLFAFVVVGGLSGAFLCLIIGALAARGVWRWLTHHSYNDVVLWYAARARKGLR